MNANSGKNSPVLLMILDGFGETAPGETNAITVADPSYYYKLRDQGQMTFIDASGPAVGLPVGQMGNSEVGHLTIGAGRTVYQDITRIDRALETGEFEKNPVWRSALGKLESGTGSLHLLGLVSDGGVHSSDRHLSRILELLGKEGLGERTWLHAFLDGRDTPPRSAKGFLERYVEETSGIGARIGTIAGRYYPMDRDHRWDRVAQAWSAVVVAEGQHQDTVLGAIQESYDAGVTDEFVVPCVIGDYPGIQDGDVVFFFNFRADRARELSEAFLFAEFEGFDRGRVPKVEFMTMTEYRKDFPCPVVFGPQDFEKLLPELVSEAGYRQLRIAETEKYAHVTFFFGGGREQLYEGEDRILVPSPKVATYDLKPEMSAPEVTQKLLEALDRGEHRFIVLNLANPDMVGHTGSLEAAAEAVRTVDRCMAQIVPKVVEMGGVVCMTADHGNCETMWDEAHKEPHTAHTLNLVPLILYGDPVKGIRGLRSGGTLADIAPTLLPFLDLEQPVQMNGRSLIR